VWKIPGSVIGRIKPKTIELTFAVSLISMQYSEVRAKHCLGVDNGSRRGRSRIVDLQLPMQSVPMISPITL